MVAFQGMDNPHFEGGETGELDRDLELKPAVPPKANGLNSWEYGWELNKAAERDGAPPPTIQGLPSYHLTLQGACSPVQHLHSLGADR